VTVLYCDCEFNGFGGQLISLALVPDDGTAPWYGELELPHQIDPWVKDHVVPKLHNKLQRPLIFKLGFQQYIQKFDNPLIICDWHADAIHFCQLLAGNDYGSSLDFECRIQILKTPPGQPIYTHNALEDALILSEWYQNEK